MASMLDLTKNRFSSQYIVENSVKAFGLWINGKIYAVMKSKSDLEKIKREWIAESDGLDRFEIKELDFEGSLPWIHPNPGMF